MECPGCVRGVDVGIGVQERYRCGAAMCVREGLMDVDAQVAGRATILRHRKAFILTAVVPIDSSPTIRALSWCRRVWKRGYHRRRRKSDKRPCGPCPQKVRAPRPNHHRNFSNIAVANTFPAHPHAQNVSRSAPASSPCLVHTNISHRRFAHAGNLPRQLRRTSAPAPRCAHHTHRRHLLLAWRPHG